MHSASWDQSYDYKVGYVCNIVFYIDLLNYRANVLQPSVTGRVGSRLFLHCYLRCHTSTIIRAVGHGFPRRLDESKLKSVGSD